MALLDMLFPQNKPGMAPANPQPQTQQGGGILAALLGQDNPAAQWASQNRNYLGTIGTGIANGLRFGDLGAARTLDTLTAQEAQQKNATQEWLAKNYPQYANLPIDQGWQLAMQLEGQKNSPKAMPDPIKLGAGETLFDPVTGQPMFTAPGANGGMADLSLTPQWGVDPQTGQYVMGQIGKDGKFYKTDMGGLQAVDPVTLAGGKATGKIDAETAAAARASLPGAEQAAAIANNAIDLVLNDKDGMKEQFGQIGPRNLVVIPGTAMGNWVANFEQAKGQAFLQAREMLKGGGQITDFEGAKAEAAFSRMDAASKLGDEATFRAAAADFRDAVNTGIQKLRAVATGQYGAGAPAITGGAPAAGGNSGAGWQVLGVE